MSVDNSNFKLLPPTSLVKNKRPTFYNIGHLTEQRNVVIRVPVILCIDYFHKTQNRIMATPNDDPFRSLRNRISVFPYLGYITIIWHYIIMSGRGFFLYCF